KIHRKLSPSISNPPVPRILRSYSRGTAFTTTSKPSFTEDYTIDLPDSTEIIWVPCLAHVIQLSLKDLLGLMKANPKNDKTATVRAFAIFINTSPQRQEAFLNLQSDGIKLAPI
ncbi:hypothetical protein N7465_012019, partial [Penicillium sp. CMV-2018d]